jgi:stage II sporulation protein GA (sporulation sigma-E factor processing peptidase)
MTTIYLDTLFLLNAMIDYLLLLCSARLAGEPLERLRFGAGAVLGGGYAVALFLPGMGFLYHPLCRLSVAVLMVLVAFARSRRLLRQILVFLALSCAFGGGVLAVSLLGGQGLSGGGVISTEVDLKMVLLSAAGCYAALSAVFRNWGRHSHVNGGLRPVKIRLGEREISLFATEPLYSYALTTGPYPAFATDLQPQMGALFSVVRGKSRIRETVWKGRFRYTEELCKMGADITVVGARAYVNGVDRLFGADLLACDLRSGAALVVAALAAEGRSVISGVSHILRGYENLDKKLRMLGADMRTCE